MSESPLIRLKRIYDPAADDDGRRVLVDRLWPRGVSREEARIDVWAKNVAPTTELRQWFAHDPSKFDEFRERYIDHLRGHPEAVAEILEEAAGCTITLLYAARETRYNHAVVLQEFLHAEGRSVPGVNESDD